jgi:hypothetical protein
MVVLPQNDEDALISEYYEKIAVCVVTCVGTYKAIATNRLTSANDAYRDSNLCIIPMPIQPTITHNLNDSALLVIEDKKNPDVNAPTQIELSIEVNNEEVENNTKTGVLTYVWYKKRITGSGSEAKDSTYSKNFYYDEDMLEHTHPDADCDWIRITNASGSSLFLDNTKKLTSAQEDARKEIEGHYMVDVYNYKNRKCTLVSSKACRVSYKPEEAVIAYPIFNEGLDSKIEFALGEEKLAKFVRIDIEEDKWRSLWNVSDDITYQWYYSPGLVEDYTDDVKIEGATNSNYIPTQRGVYYCEVTNHKNGDTKSVRSDTFFVA